MTDDKLLSSIAPGGSYELVPLPKGCSTPRALAFARAQVGEKYGFVAIASIAVRIICPRWLPLPVMSWASTWICSAVSAESTRYAGWLHNWPNVYVVVPSEFYAALHGVSVRDAVEFSATHGGTK